ncbi:acetyl-CoA carboxylase biotin carboxyl carrier protein [Taklimakanibacter deserti]|uniref:acetyl-CoA carboxylase biotin carboxyl carrier protein n=1 Tax=Taklimakanibacter deserti TaxID=2267839 RepID=UPI000E65AB9B
MDKDFIAGLIALVENADIAELEFSQGEERIKIIGRQSEAYPSQRPAAPPAVAPNDSEKEHAIIAGMSGLFHRSPAPGAEPFVSLGDAVAEGQTLALLEAMKLLTPVEANCAGLIAGIDAADGATVERGTRLFTIRPREG